MTQISDEYMQQRLATARPFTVAILRHGPSYHSPGAEAIIWEHGRRNMQLMADGIMSIACAVQDDTDIGGVAVFGTSLDDTRAIMVGDPAVKADVFRFDLHTSFSFPGDTLKVVGDEATPT